MSKSAIKTPTQENSNTVLFEMMMYYKRKMELAEETAAQDRKRLKKATAVAREAQDQVHALTMQVRDLDREIREYARANERGARMITRKHNAGLGLVGCMNQLIEVIDTVEDTAVNYNGMLGVEYISMHKRAIVGRAAGFLERFTDDLDDLELEADEVIDLTGEETEEEDVGEWV